MVSLTSLNNMISYMNYAQKINSRPNSFVNHDFMSRQFQELTQQIEKQSLANGPVIKSDAYNLKAAAVDIQQNNKNAMINSKFAKSDSTAIVATAQNTARNDTYSIKISQTAKAQSNNGIDLKKTESSDLKEGGYSLKITSGGKTTNVSFSLGAEETNHSSLEKMAKAINGSNAGVTAKVVTDEKAGTSRLELSGNNTGEGNQFTVEDVTGNAASVTGADKTTIEAQNAKYTVDGEQRESKNNDVTLDNGKVKISLKQTTSEEIKLSVKEDKTAIDKSINNFVSSFNKLVEEVNSDNGGGASYKIAQELKKVALSESGSISSIGITVGNDGRLNVDQTKLTKALEQDVNRVKRVVGGFDEIASKTTKVSDKILTGVYNLSSKEVSNDFTSYLNNGQKAMMSNYQQMGTFINALL